MLLIPASYAATSATTPGIYLGANAGLAITGEDNTSTGGGVHFTYGGLGGYRQADGWIFGGFISHASLGSATVAGVNVDNSITYFGIEGLYGLDFICPGAAVGARGGLEISHKSTNVLGGISSSNTVVILGPKASYDHDIGNGFTLGGQADILFSLADTGHTVTEFLAVLKYWF